MHERYVEAVCRELERIGGRVLDTVYFGGGTPSLLAPRQLGRLLEEIARQGRMREGAEITLEVNPGTADQSRFRALRQLGFNRLSLGAQSFCDSDLQRLGRGHSAAEAEEAYGMARRAGFDNVNLDLLFSIPGSPVENWSFTLERAVALAPEHLSVYALTVEEGTAFAESRLQGDLPSVEEEEEAQVYAWTSDRLTEAGYEHYEVSNFALPGKRSRHNWRYWTGAEYLGVGLAAHTFIAGRRTWNTSDLEEYLEKVERGDSPIAGGEEIDADTAVRERVWLGLRTDQGIALTTEERQLLEGAARFWDLLETGYLEFTGERLRLTRNGFLLADLLGLEILELLEEKDNWRRCPGRKA